MDRKNYLNLLHKVISFIVLISFLGILYTTSREMKPGVRTRGLIDICLIDPGGNLWFINFQEWKVKDDEDRKHIDIGTRRISHDG